MPDTGEERQAGVLGDAVPRNGVDRSAARREHMRAATMARQAAERLSERPGSRRPSGRIEQLAAAHERAATLRDTLARIDAEQRAWLLDQGVELPSDRGR